MNVWAIKLASFLGNIFNCLRALDLTAVYTCVCVCVWVNTLCVFSGGLKYSTCECIYIFWMNSICVYQRVLGMHSGFCLCFFRPITCVFSCCPLLISCVSCSLRDSLCPTIDPEEDLTQHSYVTLKQFEDTHTHAGMKLAFGSAGWEH